jgi:integrase
MPFKAHPLTPFEYEQIIEAVPERYQLMVETAIETGARWGELIALKPRHVDFLRREIAIKETIVEVSKKNAVDGERMITKPYPKDNEPRVIGVRQELIDSLAEHIRLNKIGADDLLFTNTAGMPISRNTFRTRVWKPATEQAGTEIRFHDLRHAHATWLLSGGSDLKSVMDRMGHAQIMTTQRYLHALPDANEKNLSALSRMKRDRARQT